MRIYTIGFTKKTAQGFFGLINEHQIMCLVDIRQRPDGQLSGFAKKGDLIFFLRELSDCSYIHMPQLSPTNELLKAYHADRDWTTYQSRFESLMDQRNVPEILDRNLFEIQNCCLLCSEASPENCHRRLIAERLQRTWGDLQIVHL